MAKEDIRDYEKLLEHSKGVDYIIYTVEQAAMTIRVLVLLFSR